MKPRRQPVGFFALRLIRLFPLYLPIALTWLHVITPFDKIPGARFIVILALLQGANIFVEWLGCSYAWRADGFWIRRGVLSPEELSVAWEDVTTVSILHPPLHRLLGCSKVVIGTGVRFNGKLTIDVIRNDAAEALLTRFEAVRPRLRVVQDGAPVVHDLAQNDQTDGIIHAMTFGDYIRVSIFQLQFLWFAAVLVEIHNQVCGTYLRCPAPTTMMHWSPFRDGSWSTVTAAVLIGAVALLYGTLVSVFKYHGFASRVGHGQVWIRDGIVSRHERSLALADVSGVRLSANPLMVAARRWQVSLIAKDTGHRTASNTIAPAVTPVQAAQILADLDPGLTAVLAARKYTGARMVLAWSLPAIAAGMSLAGLMARVSHTRVALVMTALGVVALIVAKCGRVHVTGSTVVHTSGLYGRRCCSFLSDSLVKGHVIGAPMLGGAGVGALWIFDGRPRMLLFVARDVFRVKNQVMGEGIHDRSPQRHEAVFLEARTG